jgi:HK97 family phage portal protein
MLSRIFGNAQVEERAQATVWGTWPGDVSTQSAPTVNQTSAMQLLAVAGCVRLITDSISTLPVDVYGTDKTGARVEQPKPMWLKAPTTDLDFTSWCTQILTSLLLHGNSYSAVTRSGASIVEVVPVDPNLVSVSRVNGRKVFLVNGREFPGELLHIPGMMLPGSDVGVSPLEYARQSIGLGLQAQAFGSDQFESSLNMPGVIEMPGRAQPEQMSAMAQAWRKARSKRGRGLPGVLEGGATWKPTGVTNEQAQFLQTRQWTAAEIAAQVFMVDPSDLGIPVAGTSLTYANLEQRSIRRLQVTLLPWIVRIENAVSSLLPQPRYIKFNVDGLLRGDSQGRWSVYKIASEINAAAVAYGQPPVLLTNEMRDFEDLNPVDAPAVPTAPTVPPDPPQMNSAPMVVENHLHLPEQPSPVVNVRNDVNVPEQRTPDVHVHNEPAAVVVDVQPTTVTIPATEVRVDVETAAKTTTRTVERDADGRITRVIDEAH